MTIQQIIKDALAWCKYFAVNETIGAQEVRLLFYEAFEKVYLEAAISHPEFYTKSAAFSGVSWSIPSDFRKERVFVVNDAGCISGYAKVVPNTEWDTRQSNARTAANAADPQCYRDNATFIIAPSITGGTVYYVRNFAESNFTDETQDLTLFLPIVYHPLLLAEMTLLVRIRHFKLPNTPTQREKHMAIMKAGAERMKRSLRPLEIVEGLSERPQSISSAQ